MNRLKATHRGNYRIVIEIEAPYRPSWMEQWEYSESWRKEAEEIEKQVKRHVDVNPNYVEVRSDVLCDFCGQTEPEACCNKGVDLREADDD